MKKRCKRKPIVTLGLNPIQLLIASQTYPEEEADRILLRQVHRRRQLAQEAGRG